MDYARVYREFIAHRRLREAALVAEAAYTERHHIQPKSLGGSDDRSNLIALSPEDHFFAHLLLAKIHGRGMWVALCRMRWGRVGGERQWVAGRYMYGIARRRMAEEQSRRQTGQPGRRGATNGMHDPHVRRWTNLDTGEVVGATTQAMHETYGGCRAHWASAVSGARRSMLGWTPRPEEIRVRSLKGKTFDFVARDGRAFRGTQDEFCQMANISAASGTRVVRYQSVTRCGWRLGGVEDRGHNCPKDGSRPGYTAQIVTLQRGAERLMGDRTEIARQLGTTVASVSASLYALRTGKVQTFKGYSLAS